MDSVLVVNAGSSSLKFQVFSTGADAPTSIIRGQVDGIGTRPRLRATKADNTVLADQSYEPGQVSDLAAAIHVAGAMLREKHGVSFAAVGHRVVHGGPLYAQPVLIDDEVLSQLARFVPLAPLHQPNNLAPIRAIRERFPNLPQVACFDTAFHRGHNAAADHYAIPQSLYSEGVRRYGFHGLSYEYIASRLSEIAPGVARGRVIVAHLGSGASMCALADGRSVESSMGFTALDGLPMGTRPGQIDPGIVLYLMTDKGMSPAAVQKFLYSECGLKGLSGISNDVRDLQSNEQPGAALAMEHFVYRIGLNAGMLAAALGGLDAFVFTAGIGERSSIVRARVAERLAWLGADLDRAANEAGATVISGRQSRISLLVVPTDEELMIARHTLAALSPDAAQSKTYRRTA
jgi:acetate kinase